MASQDTAIGGQMDLAVTVAALGANQVLDDHSRPRFYVVGLLENEGLEPYQSNKNYLAFFIKNK